MNDRLEHPHNRHLFIADNINLLRSMDNETIDLIVTDPPFGKGRTFVSGKLKPELRSEERSQELEQIAEWGVTDRRTARRADIEWPEKDGQASYDDIWTWQDVHVKFAEQLEQSHSPIAALINTTRIVHSDGLAAYLSYMAVRLMEMHRVLKPTGSIYLHCDYTANSYLRMLLDAVFGRDNMRGEIIWQRAGGRAKGSQHPRKTFGADTDTILFYAKTPAVRMTGGYRALSETELEERFPLMEEGTGRRYHTRVPLFSQPSMGARPNLCYTYKGVTNPHPSGWRVSRDRLAEMDARGEIIWREGKRPLRKSYADEYKGQPLTTMWADIPNLTSSRERTGYPTQKPVALAERIIQASSRPGDVVLDPFAGCAYVPVAAEGLGRQWIACDISPRAMTIVKRQFNKFRYSVDGGPVLIELGEMSQTALLADAAVTILGPNQLPERTDRDPEPPSPPLELEEPEYGGQMFKRREMLELLLAESGWTAWCCGYAVRRPNGEIVPTADNFHLDHIDPKGAGGSEYITNRAPLCARCNGQKGRRPITLRQLREEIIEQGQLLVDSPSDLPDLGRMHRAAVDLHARRYAEMKMEEQDLI